MLAVTGSKCTDLLFTLTPEKLAKDKTVLKTEIQHIFQNDK
jgi:hypothetical protein